MKSFGFPKSVRLQRSAEFDRVFRIRATVSDGRLVMHFARGEVAGTRLGLVVSRRCGNAVVRNRWKRMLREAFRLVLPELPGGLDLVVLPRSREVPSLAGLQESLRSLTARAATRLAARREET
jgi:ribonuclease P protein component